jgi:short-subunit dehydrogenase
MGTRDTANHLPRVLWQHPEAVVKEAIAAVMKGQPVCVPGVVNKFLAMVMRPMPLWMSYWAGRTFNPFK